MSARPEGFARRVFRSLREDGPSVVAQKSAAALGLRCLLLLEHDLTKRPTTNARPPTCAFRTLDASTFTAYLAAGPDVGRVAAERALLRGRVCHLALVDGAVVASSWVFRDCIESAWGRIHRPLAPDQAYLSGAHTASAFRGQGFNFALNCHIHEELRAAGVRRAFRMVVPWNAPARAAHRKAGYVELGRYYSLGLGPVAGSRFFPSNAPGPLSHFLR